MSAAVVIAASNLMPGLCGRLAEEAQSGELLTFADTEPIQALQAILERRPRLIVLERLFAATPRGAALINRIRTIVDEEIAKLQQSPPSAREFQRAINQIEASFYNRMENVGGFSGKGNQLNAYYTETGDPDYFNEDLSRYRALSASDIQAAAAFWLPANRRVELTVEPAKSTKPTEPGKNHE